MRRLNNGHLREQLNNDDISTNTESICFAYSYYPTFNSTPAVVSQSDSHYETNGQLNDILANPTPKSPNTLGKTICLNLAKLHHPLLVTFEKFLNSTARKTQCVLQKCQNEFCRRRIVM